MTAWPAGRAGPLGPPQNADGVHVPAESHGMALPNRKTLPHGIPAWVEDGAVYFITICCAARGTNQLCLADVAERIFESVRFRQERRNWFMHLLLLMPDHLHALVSFGRARQMVKVISNFKEITAKQAGIRWQRGFFDHRLRGDEAFVEKAAYIRRNPVRKGLVASGELWPFIWVTADAAAGPAVPPYP